MLRLRSTKPRVRAATRLYTADSHTDIGMEHSESSRAVILLTGGQGLLGSRVAPLLAQEVPDAQIIVVARKADPRSSNVPQTETILGDLRDESLWTRVPATITHVFHLAAAIPWQVEDRHKAAVVTDNLLPIANLIEHGQRWPNLQQIIYSSSVSVYTQTDKFLDEDSPQQPATLYGASKLAGEKLLCSLEARGVSTVSLRLSSLYGHRQYAGTVLPIMVGRALKKQDILIFGDGTRTQDFLHCEDAARAILLAFQKRAKGVYNVGTGTPVSMAELAQTVNRVFGDGATRIIFQPEKADSDSGTKLNIQKARRELNYQPQIDLESGLQQLKQELSVY
jgi:nucleoside-diphosphate-sugar epimerase